MPRVDLQVRYEEKDEAKQLGARWDPAKKVWYVPDGLDPSPFGRWLPTTPETAKEPHPNIRAPSYFIAKASHTCWKCEQTTPVFAFVLPEGYEVPSDDDDAGEDDWEEQFGPTKPSSLTWLSKSVEDRICAMTNTYRMGYSQTVEGTYWANHCQHCDRLQGDFFLFHEPGEAFCPVTPEEAARITLYPVAEPFAASCGSWSVDDQMVSFMRQA